jgi:hypothetical protein
VQFEHHYNEIAEPFDWTFTSADLTDPNHLRILAMRLFIGRAYAVPLAA